MSLCLACARSPDTESYRTPCCSLPICSACTAATPRLKEYDPCLRCAAKLDAPPSYEPVTQGEGLGEEIQDAGGGVEVFGHSIKRGETLRGIAQRYGVDPHELLKLNDLPPAALLTNPTLIQTRRSIQITSVPPSSTPSRELKRFQVVTKTADPAIGKVYMDLGGVERYFEDDEWENQGGGSRTRVRDGKWIGVKGSGRDGGGEKLGFSGDAKEKY